MNKSSNEQTRKPTGYPERVSTDSISITTNEAIFLMAHALRMAAMYYQNIPEGERGDNQVKEMVKELTCFASGDYQDPAVAAANAFIDNISATYQEME